VIKGYTLVPLSLYFKGHRVKVELGLVTNKKQHDKRATKKAADDQREIDRAVKRGR
jgi:SsrA-binding protein